MFVYKIGKEKYIYDLTGDGARINGGRWNSKGLPLIYTSSNIALASLEVAVHLNLSLVPKSYAIATIKFPDSILIKEIYLKDLPQGWNSFPYHSKTLEIGNQFIKENKFLVLKVPAAVAKGNYNYLINPLHKGFSKVKIDNIDFFEFDKRLFGKTL